MIGKDIDSITREDLDALVDSRVAEGKTIEYKRSRPGPRKSDKKEFLADVSAFANASGGDLILGIVEAGGIAKAVDGLAIDNVDAETARLEAMIRDGLEPRIPSVTIRPVPLANGRTVLVLRIRKSWMSPHRVSLGGHDKFYGRSSAGKYPLDVAELRVAFGLSEATTERIRRFRIDRISNVVAGETPLPMPDNAKVILHLVPFASFGAGHTHDLTAIASGQPLLRPIDSSGLSARYNLDGFLRYSAAIDGVIDSYVQVFRNGIVEAVAASLLAFSDGRKLIPGLVYEQELIASFGEYLAVLKALGAEPPVFVFLALVGVKGYSMHVPADRRPEDRRPTIDRDIVLVPETVVEDYEARPADVLRPCFESVWNACGYARSLNYNDAGEWAPR